jgi:hypothetical protein
MVAYEFPLKIGFPDLLYSIMLLGSADSNRHKLTGMGLPNLLYFLQFKTKFLLESTSLKVMLKFLSLYSCLGIDLIAAKAYL